MRLRVFHLLGICMLVLCFLQQPSLAREIIIDDTIKVELVNNEMSNEDAARLFSYAKSTLYDRGRYREAIKAFKAIVDYAPAGAKDVDIGLFGKSFYQKNSSLKDDALYYISKCEYCKGSGNDIGIFEQVYYLFPDGSVVKSSQLKDTLWIVLKKETYNFDRTMQIYNLLAKAYPKEDVYASHLLLEKSKENITTKKVYKESLSPWRSYVQSTDTTIDGNEWAKIKILRSEKRAIAKNIWSRFTKSYPLTGEQLDSITSFVEDNLSFDRYKFVEEDYLIEWETSLVYSFRDLLKATGIDLFDIGKGKEGDI